MTSPKLNYAVFMLCLVAASAVAENHPNKEDDSIDTAAHSSKTETIQDELISLAKADGALLVFVSFCEKSKYRTPAKLLGKLVEKQEAKSIALAKRKGLLFDEKTYRESLQAGMGVTFELMTLMPRSGENYEKNCKEVKSKVKKQLSKS